MLPEKITPRFTFSKQERLCSHKLIDFLFDKSQPCDIMQTCFPFRVLGKAVTPEIAGMDLPCSVQVLMSVSKKSFKRAVDRNRIRRQLREAYRLNKHTLQLGDKHLLLAFIWLSNRHVPSKTVADAMQKAISLINAKFSNTNS